MNSNWPTKVAWRVMLRGKQIDTVFFNPGVTADQVKQSLILFDDYHGMIEVTK